MTRILLAVLALPVVAAVAVLVAIARLARQLERDGVLPNAAPDDSEVVGMPTTWIVGDYGPETFSAADPLGPGWYVELAPTSRN